MLDDTFGEVLHGNDVDALKTALQNLMVLFETQNRNYLELKDHLKAVTFARPSLKIARGDEVTIAGDESRPPTSGVVDDAFELLAAIRLARRAGNKATAEVEGTLKSVLTQERSRRSKLESLLEQSYS
jgi:hypothetical protein